MPRARDPQREAAIEQRQPYYDGAPCAAGHTLRRVVNRACVSCQAETQRQRRRQRGDAARDRTIAALTVDDFADL